MNPYTYPQPGPFQQSPRPFYSQAVGGFGNNGGGYPNQAGSAYLPQFGQESAAPSVLSMVWTAASIAGSVGGVYHGYKRNNSIGWGLLWGFFGGIAPIIVLPLAAAQGFAKRKPGR